MKNNKWIPGLSLALMLNTVIPIQAFGWGVEFTPLAIPMGDDCTATILQGTNDGPYAGVGFVAPTVFISVDKSGQRLFDILPAGNGKYLLRIGIYIPKNPESAAMFRNDESTLYGSAGCDLESIRNAVAKTKVAKGATQIKSLTMLPIRDIMVTVQGLGSVNLAEKGTSILDYSGRDMVAEIPIQDQNSLNLLLARLGDPTGLSIKLDMKFKAQSTVASASVKLSKDDLERSLKMDGSLQYGVAQYATAAKIEAAVSSALKHTNVAIHLSGDSTEMTAIVNQVVSGFLQFGDIKPPVTTTPTGPTGPSGPSGPSVPTPPPAPVITPTTTAGPPTPPSPVLVPTTTTTPVGPKFPPMPPRGPSFLNFGVTPDSTPVPPFPVLGATTPDVPPPVSPGTPPPVAPAATPANQYNVDAFYSYVHNHSDFDLSFSQTSGDADESYETNVIIQSRKIISGQTQYSVSDEISQELPFLVNANESLTLNVNTKTVQKFVKLALQKDRLLTRREIMNDFNMLANIPAFDKYEKQKDGRIKPRRVQIFPVLHKMSYAEFKALKLKSEDEAELDNNSAIGDFFHSPYNPLSWIPSGSGVPLFLMPTPPSSSVLWGLVTTRPRYNYHAKGTHWDMSKENNDLLPIYFRFSEVGGHWFSLKDVIHASEDPKKLKYFSGELTDWGGLVLKANKNLGQITMMVQKDIPSKSMPLIYYYEEQREGYKPVYTTTFLDDYEDVPTYHEKYIIELTPPKKDAHFLNQPVIVGGKNDGIIYVPN